MMADHVSAVLKTSISRFEVSTSKNLRFYVKRELNVDENAHLSRSSLYQKFHSLCASELDFQELTSDLSISCFCRTGVINTSIILEADCECQTFRQRLEEMTLTTDDVEAAAQYLVTLHRKTCVETSSSRKLVVSKFQRNKPVKDTILKEVFEVPLHKAQTIIGPYMAKFSEKEVLRNVDSLAQRFTNAAMCLVHGNFATENICLKSAVCIGKVLVYGAETCHLGNVTYDVAVFVADLLIWYYIHYYSKDSKRHLFCQTLQDCIIDFLSKYFEDFDLLLSDSSVIVDIIGRVGGFVGIAMLFRVVGKDWNEKLPIADCEVRNEVMGAAYRLITGYKQIKSIPQILYAALNLKPCEKSCLPPMVKMDLDGRALVCS